MSSRGPAQKSIPHADDFLDLRHLLPNRPLDAHLERHLRPGAAPAGPVEADADDALVIHVDQLEVAAVGLNGRADDFDDLLYLFTHKASLWNRSPSATPEQLAHRCRARLGL